MRQDVCVCMWWEKEAAIRMTMPSLQEHRTTSEIIESNNPLNNNSNTHTAHTNRH